MDQDPPPWDAPVDEMRRWAQRQVIQSARAAITSACPNCGLTARRETYDIGSGPELSCSNCEWCWGADGQNLRPLDVQAILGRRTHPGDGGP